MIETFCLTILMYVCGIALGCIVTDKLEKEKAQKEVEDLKTQLAEVEQKAEKQKAENVELRLNDLEIFQANCEEFLEILADNATEQAEDIDTLYQCTEDNDRSLEIISKEVFDKDEKRKNNRKSDILLFGTITKKNVSVQKSKGRKKKD